MGKGSRWFEDWRCTRGTPLPDQPLLYVVVLGLHPHPPFACISLPIPPNFDPPQIVREVKTCGGLYSMKWSCRGIDERTSSSWI